MARHTAKSHKIRKVEILVIQIIIFRIIIDRCCKVSNIIDINTASNFSEQIIAIVKQVLR